MDDDQKLTELKKAYAEVILNTAKEAAARIMMSERNVLRLEMELKQSKQNALQMLMRLKQMMVAKNSEAEMTSHAQQKRIEELEAQLQEAEDIVTVLREELSSVHGEKERAPQKVSNSKDESNKGLSYIFPSLKSCVNDKDIPAIILRGKERKRNRSWCAHAKSSKLWELQKGPSLVNEEDQESKRGSPNKKKRTCGQVNKMDHVACGSYVTTSNSVKPEKPCEEGLVSVSDAFRRLREELGRPPIPIREELERPLTPIRHELTPTGRETPLSSETHVDALVTDGLLAQLTRSRVVKYTFQRKRRRGTYGSDLGNKLKKNEENRNAAWETEKVTSEEKSTPDETEKIEKLTLEEMEKVISVQESTEEAIEKFISTEEDIEKLNSTEGD